MAQRCGGVPGGCCELQAVEAPHVSALLGTALRSLMPEGSGLRPRLLNARGECLRVPPQISLPGAPPVPPPLTVAQSRGGVWLLKAKGVSEGHLGSKPRGVFG